MTSPEVAEPAMGAARGWRAHTPAAAGFVALTAGFLWPLWGRFGNHILSAGGDGSTFLWSYWAMPRAALRGENPFVTDLMFHPVGGHLAFHTTTPLVQLVAWPLTRLFGVAVAVNLLQVAAVFLSALGAYLLAHHVCGNRPAAFVAGAAFAFVPYRFVHMGGHFNLIHAEVLPIGLLALLRLLERPTRGRAGAFGLVVGLTFLVDFYYTVFLVLGAGVLVLVRRRELDLAVARRLGEAAGVACLLALPLAAVMVSALAGGELDPLPGWGGADRYSADLVSWVVPAHTHPLWGSVAASIRDDLVAGGEGLVYPGLLVLALAFLGRELGSGAQRRGWVAMATVGGVLALGPFLQFAGRAGGLFSLHGREFALPLPYAVLRSIPVVNGVRVPGRFAILAILALDVLVAVTLAAAARRWPRRATVMIGLALAVTIVEFLPGPLPMHPEQVPQPYHTIAADPDRGAVLEIPLQWQSGTALVGDRLAARDDTIFLYYATVHGRPLVSGYLSRYPQKRLDRLRAVPVYRQVLSLMGEPGFADRVTFDADDLRGLGIGFVVYHRDRPFPEVEQYLVGLGLTELADDGTIVAWKVPR